MSKHIFLREKVFTALKKKKHLEQLQHNSRCAHVSSFLFFCSAYSRVKFEVEFAAWSRLVSLISLLRPFCAALTRLMCKCCNEVIARHRFWKVGVQAQLLSAQCGIANLCYFYNIIKRNKKNVLV